tara:strand:+ start:2652 stop:3356 length:705 start_codon:yes stop_codon:yes gene_type:complete
MKFESITFTTYGYREYTENLLASSRANNTNLKLNIFTLDDESTNYFKKIHNNVTKLNQKKEFNSLVDFKSDEFGELMTKKFECIHQSLIKNDYILYIDGDITIKQDFVQTILNYAVNENVDFIFQNDKNPKKPLQRNVCAGFMLIKSTKKTIDFFEAEEKKINKIKNYRTSDQTYINKNLNKFKYKILPLDKFSNGPYFYENYGNYNPWMVHFNFVLGEEKKEIMQKYNEWYIN